MSRRSLRFVLALLLALSIPATAEAQPAAPSAAPLAKPLPAGSGKPTTPNVGGKPAVPAGGKPVAPPVGGPTPKPGPTASPVASPAAPPGAPADPPSVAPAASPSASPSGSPATPSGEATDSTAEAPNPANKPEAEEHFKRGLDLLNQEAWTAALAEFLRSRELFPTRNATNNAAFCFRKIGRFDESLDMYETLLREFPTMSADKKQAARKEVAELRALVGTIDVVGAEPGASIVVDGRPRAEYPLIDPLRVSAGTHAVRLFKEGFRPYEGSVEVAGGQTVRIAAKMPALTASGRLKVSEKSGKKLDVVVDGAVVGVTPWEGSLAVGGHVVLLQGDGDLGTPPSAAPVRKDEITAINLSAEALECSLLIDVNPTSGRLLIDSVPVGRGVWDGRLKTGTHTLVAEEDGFFSQKRSVTLGRGDRQDVHLKLERDENADQWRKPSKIVIDVSGGFAVGPSFGGDVTASCSGSCSKSPEMGGLAILHAAYEFGSGFGVGLAGGFFQASQTLTGRKATLQPVGIEPGLAGTSADTLRLSAALVGVTAGMHLGDRFPVHFRLGAGALIGSARNVRDGAFTTRAGSSYDAPALQSQATAAFVYVDPEATVGFRLGSHAEIGIGAQALILIAASSPTWGDGSKSAIVAGSDGLSKYPSDDKLLGTTVVFVPGAKARFDF